MNKWEEKPTLYRSIVVLPHQGASQIQDLHSQHVPALQELVCMWQLP